MTRIVAHVRWRLVVDSEAEHQEEPDPLVEPMFERAIALGGRIVGWGASSMAVDFSRDGLYDAVDFLIDAPLAPELSAGLCIGELELLCDGQRLALAVGTVLKVAADLAELARPGEVLVSPELVSDSRGRLGTAGEVEPRRGRPKIRAFVLDPVNPLLDSIPPGPMSQSDALELVSMAPRHRAHSSRAPESERARHVDRLMSATEALGDAAPAVFPPEITAVLKKRDAESLQQLAKSVRANHAIESAERLDAIADLAGGKSGEALRRLRASKMKSVGEDSSARCRASLALAVALSAAGRPYEAAIEALDGVARAREGDDRRGELACARFLSQLAAIMGDGSSSDAWRSLH